MKFAKNLVHEIEHSDPEWGPFFMNYKLLKKRLNQVANNLPLLQTTQEKAQYSKDFFRELMREMKKICTFFESNEETCRIRRSRILLGVECLKNEGVNLNKKDWSRMMNATVQFYKDTVLMENYAVVHFSGFSKIIKKHDKITGFNTRESFTRNVMHRQNFVKNSFITGIIAEAETLFRDLRGMEK